MNEQIEKLGRESFGSTFNTDPILVYEAEQFAELIVKECAHTANEWQTREHPGLLCKNVILDHFGIKE